MDYISCTFVDNNEIIIRNLPTDNERKINKLKILLNYNKQVEYSLADCDLGIKFLIDDSFLLGLEIKKTISSIEAIFDISLKVDYKTKEIIEESDKLISEFEESYNNLKKLKQIDYVNTSEFKNFVSFCDSTLSCKLRPYQYSASYFLSIGRGGFDFSVPGSGKTIITYSSYNYFKRNNICDYVFW